MALTLTPVDGPGSRVYEIDDDGETVYIHKISTGYWFAWDAKDMWTHGLGPWKTLAALFRDVFGIDPPVTAP